MTPLAQPVDRQDEAPEGFFEGMLEYQTRTNIRELFTLYGDEEARQIIAGMVIDAKNRRARQ